MIDANEAEIQRRCLEQCNDETIRSYNQWTQIHSNGIVSMIRQLVKEDMENERRVD